MEGYKKTELGWIPDDWEVKELGDCLLNFPDYGINAASVPYDSNLPTYLRITDINENGRFINQNKTSVDHKFSQKYLLNEGDLVFARTGASVGKSYLYNKKDGLFVFAGFLIRVKPNPQKLNSIFLKLQVETSNFWKWVEANSMRSGQPGINSQEYSKLLLPIPTLAEQTAIATALSDVDNLIATLERKIEKKRNIKQGAMHQLLTGKKRLDGFSGEFCKISIKDLGKVLTGNTPSRTYQENWGGTFPWISAQDFTGKYITDSKEKITNIGKQSVRIIPAGSILVTCIASIGLNAICSVDCATNQQINSIICNQNYNSEFVYYLISHNVNQLKSLAGQTAVPIVNKTTFECIEVYVPPTLAEQTAIATILSDMDAEIAFLEKKRDKYKNVKSGMMQQLLTGKVRLVNVQRG